MYTYISCTNILQHYMPVFEVISSDLYICYESLSINIAKRKFYILVASVEV